MHAIADPRAVVVRPYGGGPWLAHVSCIHGRRYRSAIAWPSTANELRWPPGRSGTCYYCNQPLVFENTYEPEE